MNWELESGENSARPKHTSSLVSRLSASVSPSPERISDIATLGLRYVELGPLDDHQVVGTDDNVSGVIARIKEALDSFGITPATMHAPSRPEYDFGSLDERPRSIALAHHRRHLSYCSRLGAALYIIHPGGLIHANWDDRKKIGIWPHNHEFSGKLWRLNAECLAELADYAKDLGIRVCLENGWLNDPNFMTLEDFLGILREANRDNAGACIDTGHANIGQVIRPSEVIKSVGSAVWAVHLQDNDGTGDQHLPPGRGNIEWGSVISALDGISYKGTLNVEADPKEGVTFLARLLDTHAAL